MKDWSQSNDQVMQLKVHEPQRQNMYFKQSHSLVKIVTGRILDIQSIYLHMISNLPTSVHHENTPIEFWTP